MRATIARAFPRRAMQLARAASIVQRARSAVVPASNCHRKFVARATLHYDQTTRPQSTLAYRSDETANIAPDKVGFAGIDGLVSPEMFEVMVDRASSETVELRSLITSAGVPKTVDEARIAIARMDKMSDVVCGVSDVANFCRHVHYSERWRSAAEKAVERMFEVITALNSDTELFACLRKISNDVTDQLAQEEQHCLQDFILDMQQGGLDTHDVTVAAKATTLRHSIDRLAYTFEVGCSAPLELDLPMHLGSSVPHLLPIASKHINDDNTGFLRFQFPWAQWANVLSSVSSPEIQKIFEDQISRDTPARNDEVLTQFSRECWELARILGYNSYSELKAERHMLSDSDTIDDILNALSEGVKQAARNELVELQQAYGDDNTPQHVRATDIPRLMYKKSLDKESSYSGDNSEMRDFLSFEAVCAALNELCQRVFGVTMAHSPMAPNEGWVDTGSIYKFNIVAHDDGSAPLVLGDVYLDLFPRQDKYANATNWTIQGSRQVANDSVMSGAGSSLSGSVSLSCPTRPTASAFQRPVVAIVMDCLDVNVTQPQIHPSRLRSLFHEFGHALHAVFSRSTFHNLSGSRTPTDFSEIPSQLFERFLRNPEYVSKFFRHSKTREPMPEHLARRICSEGSSLEHVGLLEQVLISKFDHDVFGPTPPFESPSLLLQHWQKLHNDVGQALPVPMTPWRNVGLSSYSGVYFSYIVADAAAEALWEKLFAGKDGSSPADCPETLRRAGDNLRYQLLQPGNGLPALQTLMDTLLPHHNGNAENRRALANVLQEAVASAAR